MSTRTAADLRRMEETAARRRLRRPAPPPSHRQHPKAVFAASQLAERLRLLEVNLRAISAGQKPWAPPHSELNLRDRIV